MGTFVGNRGPLCDRDDTRSSPHPSVVTLGCLDEGDERGKGVTAKDGNPQRLRLRSYLMHK